MKRKVPSVTRIAAPDEEAKIAALKLLIERPVRSGVPGKTAPTGRRDSTTRS